MYPQNYISKKLTENKALFCALFFLSFSYFGMAQVRVNFTPREPVASPSTSIHHVKGDFSLIGNTNKHL